MPLDCSDIPSNISYNCENPWGQNCTGAKRFDFVTIWNYTLHIQEACANDSRLFLSDGEPATRQNAALNQAACVAIAGSDWTRYSAVDIWTRLTTWKLPLIQLVAAFPCPPLSPRVQFFVITHLLGDPIDTIKTLLLKLSKCQHWVHYWMNFGGSERQWKALALLTDAYGEWGEDKKASRVLRKIVLPFKEGSDEMKTIYQTAEALAADRATKSLPIIIALSIFIGAVGIAVGRTASAGAFSETIFINIEAHGIATSAMYFWVIPAVFLSSVIGVSQTQAAIPRILRRLENELRLLELPQKKIEALNELKALHERPSNDNDERRKFYGGIYSWQPAGSGKWNGFALSAILIVIIGTITALTISSLVPPDGPDCRQIGELCMCVAWILSAYLDTIFSYKDEDQALWFYGTLTKDILTAIGTLGWVILVNVGYLNRCDCYTMWGSVGLALPEMPQVADKLGHRINTTYPGIAFASISLQLIVIPSIICIRYLDALRVFVQRDDGLSNAGWFRKLWCRFSNTEWPRGPRRSKSANPEEGRVDNLELPTTTIANEDASYTHDSGGEDTAGAAHVVTGVEPISPFGTCDSPSENVRRRPTDPQGVKTV